MPEQIIKLYNINHLKLELNQIKKNYHVRSFNGFYSKLIIKCSFSQGNNNIFVSYLFSNKTYYSLFKKELEQL